MTDAGEWICLGEPDLPDPEFTHMHEGWGAVTDAEDGSAWASQTLNSQTCMNRAFSICAFLLWMNDRMRIPSHSPVLPCVQVWLQRICQPR